MPLAGQTKDLQSNTLSEKKISPQGVPVRRPTPAKVTPLIKPQQVTVSGHQQPVCEGEPLPDIEIENITINGSGKNGESHEANVTIVNHGQCATGVFSIKGAIRIQAQGIDRVEQLGVKYAPSLEPCRSESCVEASYSAVFTFIPQYNHALYDITVDADADKNVNEFRKNNNSIHDDLRIQIN